MSRASITFQGEHEWFEAMLDVLTLGISEAVTDLQLGRPERIDLMTLNRALTMAEHLDDAMKGA